MRLRLTILLAVLATLVGCTTQDVLIAHTVPLDTAATPYVDNALLDIGVVVFESGVPEGEIDRETLEELMRDGHFIQIRRAEAIFLAVKLKETLQSSGHWGAVWAVPSESTAVDLNVRAEILQSDGNILDLQVTARDSEGQMWLSKKYDMETAAGAYNRQRYPNLDPYQDVFNEIANDLAAVRAERSAAEIENLRAIAALRYAGDLSPQAFGDYVVEDRGDYELARLPAADDPMYRRTQAVRQREQLVFETLDQYYEQFTLDGSDSYDGWREYSREDSIRLADASRSAKTRTALGALAIALSIAAGQQTDRGNLAESMIVDAGIYIGGDILRSAGTRRQERREYQQLLEELSASFDNEMKPLVVEMQGTQHRLTGTAEAQYEEWRQFLQELFISETGFEPENMNIYAEPDEEPLVEEEGAPAASTASGAGSAGAESAGAESAGQASGADASGGAAQDA